MALNGIAILFRMEKNRSLESLIKEALDSWYRRRETKNLTPECVVFSSKQKDITPLTKILELEVKFRADVQPNHFKIENPN